MDKGYYAVERSGDHLSHYGVKGTKWGVKKAIASGSSKKMDKVFAGTKCDSNKNRFKKRRNSK